MYINKQNIARIVRQEIIKEGWKDYALAGAIGLGSMFVTDNVYGANKTETQSAEYSNRLDSISDILYNRYADYDTMISLYKELGELSQNAIGKTVKPRYIMGNKKRAKLLLQYAEDKTYNDLLERYRYYTNINDINGLKDLLSVVKRFNSDCGIINGRFNRLAFNIARKINLLRSYNEIEDF